MTASERRAPTAGGDDTRSLADRLVDLVVYAPVGLVVAAAQELPELADKGRDSVGLQLHNARVVGRFAVDAIGRQVAEQVEWLVGQRAQPRDDVAPAPAPQPARQAHPAGTGGTDAKGPATPAAAAPADPARDLAVDRAIPDYDTLSASQVVRRLDSLTPDELRAVTAHESVTRGRRTVLSRAQQLLGVGAPPSTSPGT